MVLSPTNRGEAIRKALGMTPAEVIRALKTARLRGRGGAGFPCGMKWEFTRSAEGDSVSSSSATPTRASPARSKTGCCSRRRPTVSSPA